MSSLNYGGQRGKKNLKKEKEPQSTWKDLPLLRFLKRKPSHYFSFLSVGQHSEDSVFLCSKMPRETKAKNPIPEPEHPRRSKARGVSELLTGCQRLFLLHILSSWSSPEPSLIFPPSLTPSSLPVTSKAQHFE